MAYKQQAAAHIHAISSKFNKNSLDECKVAFEIQKLHNLARPSHHWISILIVAFKTECVYICKYIYIYIYMSGEPLRSLCVLHIQVNKTHENVLFLCVRKTHHETHFLRGYLVGTKRQNLLELACGSRTRAL